MLFSGKKRKVKAKKVVRSKKVKKAAKKRVKRASKGRAKKAGAPKKRVIKVAPAASRVEGSQIGSVTHYFPHVKAGAIMIEKGTLAVGDVLHIKGHTTDLKQKVKSMQINRVPVQEASVGDEVGILVKSRVRINDRVYKVKS